MIEMIAVAANTSLIKPMAVVSNVETQKSAFLYFFMLYAPRIIVCIFNYVRLCLIGVEMVNNLLSYLRLLLYINERKYQKDLYKYS